MFSAFDARQLNEVAVNLQAQGECREALDKFLAAARLYRAAGDVRGEGRCLNGAGACSKDIGEIESAHSYLEQALTLRIRSGDALGEAITLTTLGPVYQLAGKPADAQRALDRALALTTALGAEERRGQVLFNLAVVAETAGRLAQARLWYERAREVAEDTGNDVEAAKCTGGLATVAISLGMTGEAFRNAQQWLEQSRAIGHARGESCALHALGTLFYDAKEYAKAKAALEQSIEIDVETGAPAEAEISRAALARVLMAMGRGGDARRAAEEALASARRLGAPNAESQALGALADVLGQAGEADEALRIYEQELAAARRAGARLREAWALAGIALMQEELKRRARAFASLDEAAKILDEVRGDISQGQQRQTFFGQREVQSVYAIYVDLLLKEYFDTGDSSLAARAFAVRERAHTRELLEFLHAKTMGGTVPPQASPSITLPEAQRLLDDDTVLIEYSVHKGVSYAFVVVRDGFEIVRLPAAAELRLAVEPGLQGYVLPGSVSMLRAGARDIHAAAFAPLVEHFGGRKRLIVVPDDVLTIVPLQMLPAPDDPSSYLVKSYTISYAPSASALRALRREHGRTRPMEFLGFAPVCDDDLLFTRGEVEAIAALFPGKTTTRFASSAAKGDLTSLSLADYRFLHFATHAVCDGIDENGSALVMHGRGTQERLLYTYEIADLHLDADLVVLSACETALGAAAGGEGRLGLTRAFLLAGASAVCSSLWDVDDEATSALMQRFYTALRSGRAAVDALRDAQLELLRDPRFADPEKWAAFILMG